MSSSYSIVADQHTEALVRAVDAYVAAPTFPCVGARSAFNKARVRYGRYGRLGARADVATLCADLECFSEEFARPGTEPVTFVAMFADEPLSESLFADRMWRELQKIHAHDRNGFDWDPQVSADPTQPDFSFSVAGRAFFIVGLHPGASRIARRAPVPCLVFNFHDQFEALRTSGKYGGLQKVIRQRDLALQGTINPVLARFGEASEARQYSGQPVGDGWKCPFHATRTAVEAG